MNYFNTENDADWKMMELTRRGNIAHELKKEKICMHGWYQDKKTHVVCLHCGKTWDNIESFYAEYDELKEKYF
jgi:hypothetical protein